eukprot:scaffold3218_cov161-Pinguiococcus_pyrenoidosus.AAC.1
MKSPLLHQSINITGWSRQILYGAREDLKYNLAMLSGQAAAAQIPEFGQKVASFDLPSSL